MTAGRAKKWLGGGIALWALSAVVVLAAHGGGVAALMSWPQPAAAGAPEAVVMLDLSPVTAAPTTEKSDIAPDPLLQQQSEKPPEPAETKDEKEPDPEPPQKVEPPQKAEVELPPPPKPTVKPVQKKMASVNTRPISADRIAPQATTPSPGALGRAKAEYGQLIVAHLNHNKNYPSGPRSRHEEGTVMLTFTVDRGGRLISGRISRGSGHDELDREALDMLRRAQPYPTPPADLAGVQFPFSAPMRYYLR